MTNLRATIVGAIASLACMSTATAQAPAITITNAQLSAARAIPAVEVFRLLPDEKDSTHLGWPIGIAVNARGELFIADQKKQDVKVFDRQGRYVRHFGQPGIAGELERPDRIDFANDTVYVNDSRVITLFTADGRFVRYIVPDTKIIVDGREQGYSHVQSLAHVPGGLIATLPINYHGRKPNPYRDTVTLRRLDVVTGKLPEIPVTMITPEMFSLSQGMYMGGLFAATPRMAVGENGRIYVTEPDGRTITIYATDGTRAQQIIFSATPIPLTPAIIDAELEGRRQLYKSAPVPQGMPARDYDAIIEGMRKIPPGDVRPVIGEIIVGENGELLVQRLDLRPVPTSSTVTTSWDYLDADGKLVGRVTLPTSFKPMTLSRDVINGTTGDSFEKAPTVVQYRLTLARR